MLVAWSFALMSHLPWTMLVYGQTWRLARRRRLDGRAFRRPYLPKTAESAALHSQRCRTRSSTRPLYLHRLRAPVRGQCQETLALTRTPWRPLARRSGATRSPASSSSISSVQAIVDPLRASMGITPVTTWLGPLIRLQPSCHPHQLSQPRQQRRRYTGPFASSGASLILIMLRSQASSAWLTFSIESFLSTDFGRC